MSPASNDRSYYDDLETRDPNEREAALFAALPQHLARAREGAPALAAYLTDIDPAGVTDRAALARLPIMRKSDLPDAMAADPPFAGHTTVPPGGLRRIFASPGPIYDAEGAGPDYWRMARALYASGVRAGDVVHNCFAYHFTPAGVMFEEGATALGAAVVPAGVGNTDQQVRAIADIRPRVWVGTPDFLKVILDKADEQGIDLSCLAIAHVSGGPLFADLKAYYADRGIEVFQSYGTADLGLIAYETAAREGLVVDEGIILEIVRPGTGDPVPDGEVGEVVVTGFSPVYPLVRLATGDMSAIMAGPSPCGRTAPRIKGWMGRADQTTKVRGMFVHPRQVAEVTARHGLEGRARLTVTTTGGRDAMTLDVEANTEGGEAGALAARLAETLQAITKLRGEARIVAPGSLPNDGKVIADERSG